MKKIFIVLSIIFLTSQTFCGQTFFKQHAFADEVLDNKIDFAAAIKYSLEHNNNIRAMRNGLSATERDIGIARSDIMPKIRFNENFTATNNPIEAFSLKLNQTRAVPKDLAFGTLDFPGAVTNFLTAGIVEQTIYNRKSMIAIKMAKKEYSANGYIYLRKQEELVNQVAQAYLNVSTDQEFIKIAEQAIKDAKEHLNIAEDRYKRKLGLMSDVLRAKTAVENTEQKLISAQRNLKVAKRNLGLQLGLETSVEISDTIPDIKLQDINYYKDFSVYRNDIKATEINVENAKNNIKSAQAGWFPTLNAIASYNAYNSNFPFGAQGSNYIAGAFFKWDVFDGNKRKYEILKAKDKEAEAEEYLEGLKKAVDFKVYEVYSNVEEHKKNLEITIAALKTAEEDAKLVEKRWQEDALPFVALIDAQTNLDTARTNLVKNQFDLKEDLINLGYESGIIYQELNLK